MRVRTILIALLSLFLFPRLLSAPPTPGLDSILESELIVSAKYNSILVLNIRSDAPAVAASDKDGAGIQIDFGDVHAFGSGITPAGRAGRNLDNTGAAYQTNLKVEVGVAGFNGVDLYIQGLAGDSIIPYLHEGSQGVDYRDRNSLKNVRTSGQTTIARNIRNGWRSYDRQLVLNIPDNLAEKTLSGAVTYTLVAP